MRILIAEDDYVSRKFLMEFLSDYGVCDVTVDGKEAIEAFMISLDLEEYYDLICLDIMMPEIDGTEVLRVIRDMELDKNVPKDKRAKIIMMTALSDKKIVKNTYSYGSQAYAVKPLDTDKILVVLKKLDLIN